MSAADARGLRLACPVRRRGLGRRGAHVLASCGLLRLVMGGLGLRVHLACMAFGRSGEGRRLQVVAPVSTSGGGRRQAAAAADRKTKQS